jgi:hypothetical protein
VVGQVDRIVKKRSARQQNISYSGDELLDKEVSKETKRRGGNASKGCKRTRRYHTDDDSDKEEEEEEVVDEEEEEYHLPPGSHPHPSSEREHASPVATSSNVFILQGPIASGKTRLVYAVAKQFDFNVIEVNSSQVRNGAAIKKLIRARSTSPRWRGAASQSSR